MAAPKNKKKTPKKITETYLHNAGLYYLQRFAASSGQFRRVMGRKVRTSCLHHADQDYDACMALVDPLVAKFERSGLLNDAVYTRGAVSSLRRGGKSRRAILTALQAKHIDPALIAESLEECDAGNTEKPEQIAALVFLRRKKAGPFAGDKDAPPEKIISVMARAGFNYETVRAVLNLNRDEAERILDLLQKS